MTADGFLEQKQRHPFALAAAVGINLAAVTALLLAKSGYVPPIKTILIGNNIPLTQPPPPNPPESRPEAKQLNNRVDSPTRRVPTEPIRRDPPLTETGTTPSGSGEPETGFEPRPEPSPTATPVPVLTEASPLPSTMREFQPPYPPQLLRTGVEGKVVVRVLIGPDGLVKQVAVISAADPLFADATERQALRRWRFKPATRDGAPVEAWKQLTVRFEIR